MFSFLAHEERLPLATTCKAVLDLVEIFSKAVMEEIRSLHRVDETFESRILSRFERQLGDVQDQLEWKRTVQPKLPQRCRLWAPLKSRLYTLNDGDDDGGGKSTS